MSVVCCPCAWTERYEQSLDEVFHAYDLATVPHNLPLLNPFCPRAAVLLQMITKRPNHHFRRLRALLALSFTSSAADGLHCSTAELLVTWTLLAPSEAADVSHSL